MIIECPSKRLFDTEKMVFTDTNKLFSLQTLENFSYIRKSTSNDDIDSKMNQLTIEEQKNISDFAFLFKKLGNQFIENSVKKLQNDNKDLKKQRNIIFNDITKKSENELSKAQMNKKSSCNIM